MYQRIEMKRASLEEQNEICKKLRVETRGVADGKLRADIICKRLNIDDTELTATKNGPGWLYTYKDKYANSIPNLIYKMNYITSHEANNLHLLAEVSEGQHTTVPVCKKSNDMISLFNDYIKDKPHPKTDEELIFMMRKFTCDIWIHIGPQEDQLAKIKDNYNTLRLLYFDNLFSEFILKS